MWVKIPSNYNNFDSNDEYIKSYYDISQKALIILTLYHVYNDLFSVLWLFQTARFFEGWDDVDLNQIKQYLPVFSNPNMDITTTQDILLFRLMLRSITLFYGSTYVIELSIDLLFCVSNICRDYFRTSSVWNIKISLFRRL